MNDPDPPEEEERPGITDPNYAEDEPIDAHIYVSWLHALVAAKTWPAEPVTEEEVPF